MRIDRSLIIGSLLLVSCAQVGSITGGEKDVVPPQLVSATPPNGSLHFNSSVIRLGFDERIQLDRFRDKALISPPLDAAPDVRIVGSKDIEIRLNAPLAPNTTYTFNLGSAVKDLAEGNTSPDLTYVFSTGSSLDSLGLVGAVVNAFTGVPEPDLFILLYATDDTSTFRSGRPTYMTRSRANGTFALGYLPEGQFRAYALRDKNANLRYDLPNEDVAFLDQLITLSAADSVAPLLMRSFLPESPVQSVRASSVTADGALRVVLARSADTVVVRDVARTGGSLSWIPEWNATRDTVLLWPSDTTLVSEGTYQLSDAGGVLDTLKYRPVTRMPFHTGITVAMIEGPDSAWIRLRASRPIERFDTTRIRCEQDSIALPFTLTRSDDPRSLLLHAKIDPGSSVSLTLLPKSVHDIYGGTNDTLRAALGRALGSATGSLRIALQDLPSDGSFILQLLDAQRRVIREGVLDGTSASIAWDRLDPGIRSLRLIDDVNGNGRWDTGVLDVLRPERTWYHAELVNIRASWDITVDWSLDEPDP